MWLFCPHFSTLAQTDNYKKGLYFAQLTRQLLDRQEADPNRSKSEFRLSVYGRKM